MKMPKHIYIYVCAHMYTCYTVCNVMHIGSRLPFLFVAQVGQQQVQSLAGFPCVAIGSNFAFDEVTHAERQWVQVDVF